MVASMAFGILTTTGWVRKSIKRTTIYGGHMILAVTTLAFTAMHAISYALQSSGALSPAQIVIPFMGEAEVAVGIISFELMAAAAASVWLQRRFGYRRWQMFHWITYVAFGLGIGHVVATSSEVTQGPLAVGFFGIALVVVALAVMRSLPTTTLGRERIAVLEP